MRITGILVSHSFAIIPDRSIAEAPSTREGLRLWRIRTAIRGLAFHQSRFDRNIASGHPRETRLQVRGIGARDPHASGVGHDYRLSIVCARVANRERRVAAACAAASP